MNTEQTKLWYEGKTLWNEYVNLNGYSFTFNNDGIKKLSKNLDLNAPYLKKCINIYLEN